MSDKAFVGTLKDGSGRRFFAIEREGRRMPLLDGRGEVAFWSKAEVYQAGYGGQNEFARVLKAMDKPEELKVVAGPHR